MIQEEREELTQLIGVPIDEYYHLKLLHEINERGGSCTRTGITEHDSERFGRWKLYMYDITLPKGTYRVFGARNPYAHRFTVHFRDGHIMDGAIVYRQNVPPGEKPTIETLYPVV
jgi:hypothetical protein